MLIFLRKLCIRRVYLNREFTWRRHLSRRSGRSTTVEKVWVVFRFSLLLQRIWVAIIRHSSWFVATVLILFDRCLDFLDFRVLLQLSVGHWRRGWNLWGPAIQISWLDTCRLHAHRSTYRSTLFFLLSKPSIFLIRWSEIKLTFF